MTKNGAGAWVPLTGGAALLAQLQAALPVWALVGGVLAWFLLAVLAIALPQQSAHLLAWWRARWRYQQDRGGKPPSSA